jgi:hypothetical protein
MSMSKRFVAAGLCLFLSAAAAIYRAQSAPDMVATANTFLASLNQQQVAKVKYDLTHDERQNWFFTPVPRNGLPLKEMEQFQRPLAMAMLSAALSQRGFMKATTIMSLEQILRDNEAAARAAAAANPAPAGGTGRGGGGGGRGGGGGGINRDPELYFFTIFGAPSNDGPWGWRVEGHHVAVNVTMDKGKIISAGPTFFGSNPASVKEGPRQGLRVLGREEDLGRALFMALDPAQKKTALLDVKAPGDIITMNSKRVEFGTKTQYAMPANPEGLQASKLNSKQTEQLMAIIQEYTAGRTTAEYAAVTLAEIKKAGTDKIYFAWAGGEKLGDPHYYRVHGPTFLIEYDNTQNNANHVHSVFRDLRNDFGVDSLREHYKAAHGLD